EVTDNPSGYKLEQWQWHAGSWHHVKNISMLVDGGKPEDFLFKLSGEQHYETLTKLLEKSKKEIPTAAKSAVLQYVGIKVDNLIIRHKNGLGYYLSYAPTEGERPINFVYNANGERVLNQ